VPHDRDADVVEGLSERPHDVLVSRQVSAASDGLTAEEVGHRGKVRRDRRKRLGPAGIDGVEQSVLSTVARLRDDHGPTSRTGAVDCRRDR
jgi:hypothetical protein